MCRAGGQPAPPSAAVAGARVHAQDSAAVQMQEVEDLGGHGVEARAGLDVVIVVVGDVEARGVHGEGPEAEQVHLLAQFQRRRDQDEAGADALGAHPEAKPVARHVDQVLRVEVVHGLRRLEVVQHVLDADGHVGVARVVECRQQHGRVLVHLQHPVEGPPPLLQLVEPGGSAG